MTDADDERMQARTPVISSSEAGHSAAALGHPRPGTRGYNQFVTLFNDLSAMCREHKIEARFSDRQRLAASLWAAGYRPTDARVAGEVADQRLREHVSTTIAKADREGA